jgi:hypothetical protein
MESFIRRGAPGTATASRVVVPTKRRRLARWSVVLGALVVSTGVALLVAEVAVRLVHPQPLILKRPDVWYPVGGLGWDRSPDLDTTVNFGGAGVVRLLTDHEGNRIGANGALSAPDLRVLVVGDSFVEALQVEYEDTTAARLEAALSADTGRRVRVEDSGVGGWNPNQYRLRARQRLATRHYDLVLVFVYTENDVITASSEWLPPRHPAPVHALRLPAAASFDEVRDAVFYPVNDWLEERSQAFILFKKGMDPVLAEVGLTAKTLPYCIRREDAQRDWWDITGDVCADIAREAAARGVPTAFVLVPPAYLFLDEPMRELGYDPATMDLEQPHRLIRERLLARRLDVIDLLPVFRANVRPGGCCYGDVDSHLNAEGHRVATGAIEPEALALLDRAPVATAAR